MYAILEWIRDDFVTTIQNSDGSIKLFEKLSEADNVVNSMSNPDRTRVISIEPVEE